MEGKLEELPLLSALKRTSQCLGMLSPSITWPVMEAGKQHKVIIAIYNQVKGILQ